MTIFGSTTRLHAQTGGEAVGNLSGQLTVSDMGAAVYSLTFDVPDGGPLTPQIGIAYNSQMAGYGLAGYGFKITGISCITRGGKDLFHNQTVQGVTYTDEDNYFLDGKRLILKEGQQGKDGSKYCLEGDPYTEILMHNRVKTTYIVHDPGTGDEYFEGRIPYYVPDSLVDRTDETICWFEVKLTNGQKVEYGKTSDSKLQYANRKGQEHIAAWYIDRVEDLLGDYCTYSYNNKDLTISPAAITYGKHENLSQKVSHQIRFGYQELGVNSCSFVQEDQNGVLNICLSKVETLTNNQLFRKYYLNYDGTSDLSVRKWHRLTSVVEENSKGERLRPLEFNWEFLPQTDIKRTIVEVPTEDLDYDERWLEEKEKTFLAVDINGDGVSDIARLSKTSVHGGGVEKKYTFLYIYLSKVDIAGISYSQRPVRLYMDPEGVSSLIAGILQNSFCIDYNNDGYNDLIIPYFSSVVGRDESGEVDSGDGNEHFYVIDGDKVVGTRYSSVTDSLLPERKSPDFSIVLKSKTSAPLVIYMDIDGDGISEIVSIETEKDKGRYPYYISKYNKEKEIWETQEQLLSMSETPKRIFSGDYNNDGLMDLIILSDRNYTILFNGGSSSSAPFSDEKSKVGITLCSHTRIEQGDFNGDGQIDYVYTKEDNPHIYIAFNNGDGTFFDKEIVDIGESDQTFTGQDNDKFAIVVWDANYDGLSDVTICKADYDHSGFPKYRTYYTNTKFITMVSNGETLVDYYKYKGKREKDALQGTIFVGDFDGDGYAELANYGSNLFSTDNSKKENEINVYKIKFDLSKIGKITEIKDAFGNETIINYDNLTNPAVYSKEKIRVFRMDYLDDGRSVRYECIETPQNYPVNLCTIPLSVVSMVSRDNGSVGMDSIKYQYENLKIHIAGRGILGFGTVTQENETLGIKTVTKTVQWDSTRWIPTEIRQETSVKDLNASKITSYIVAPVGVTYFTYASRIASKDFDGEGTVSLSKYDLEKGIVVEKSIYYDSDDMYKMETYDSLVFKGGSYHPVIVTATQKHLDDEAPFVSVNKYDYDNKGNLLKSVNNANSSMPLTTTMTYDEYGNMKSSVTTGQGVKSIKTFYDYDETKRFVTRTYTEPASSVKTYTYDVWGNVLTETDSTNTAFPLTTRHQYDAWGRKTSTTNALGLMTCFETGWGKESTEEKKYYALVKTEGQAPDSTWYDKLGREVSRSTVGLKGVRVSTSTHYNDKGQVDEVVSKQGKLIDTITYTYDDRGRVEVDTSSTGRSVRYKYDNRKTETTVAGRKTTTTFDAWGNVIEVVDPISNVTYKYHSNGQPKSVTSGTSTVTMTYDEVGNQTALCDPDAGTMTYSYAADGKMLSQTDAKGVETLFKYDELGRVSSTKIGDKTITNTYGTAGNEILQLTKQTMDGNVLEYTHDEYGRVKTEKRTVGQMGVYEFKYNYNRLGQLAEKHYPGGVKESYQYDQYGFKTNTFANGMVIYKVDDYDGLEKRTTFMESLKRIVTHDAKGYLSCKRLTCGDSDTDLEKFQVTYDYETGNLLSRKRNKSAQENFGYDALDRLTSVKVGSSNRLSMTYADNGNILSKSDVGRFTYGDKLHPHAVTRIKKEIRDEELGDALKTQFNALGKIRVIIDTKQNLAQGFEYGPDQQRWYSYLTDKLNTVKDDSKESEASRSEEYLGTIAGAPLRREGDLRTTIYASDYEKVTEGGKIREFYYLDGGVIAVKQDGVLTPYLAFADNLGSILAVYAADGKKVFDAEYDAWGKQTVSLNEIGLQRGYTGHEMLNEFGIINMNGRLYDPVLGRFFSPDNYVQAPDNSQNFNRYSYCLNNPLKYNDPSGEFWELVIAGAIYGAIQYGAMAEMNGGNFWNGAWKGALIGGASSYCGMSVGGAVSSSLGSTGFWAGAAAGTADGATRGFIGGAGSAWANGSSFKNVMKAGGISAGIGAGVGGFLGGLNSGLDAYQHGGNFWTGNGATYEYSYSVFNWDDPNRKFDMNEPIEMGPNMEYTNEYAQEFSDKNFPNMKCIKHLYADGSVPNKIKYFSKNGYIYNVEEKHYVRGICVKNGLKNDVYLAKTAFISKESLYLTMGHEYLHALYNGGYYFHADAHHPYIYEWQYQQADAWKYYESVYAERYFNTTRDPLWRMHHYKYFSHEFPGIITSRPL